VRDETARTERWHPLSEAERAELAALRHRAYGPDADIAADDAALDRLIELEDRARPEAPLPIETEAEPITAAPVAVPAPAATEPPDSMAASEDGRRRMLRRSVLTAAIAVAAVVVASQLLPAGADEAAPAASITPVALAPLPQGSVLIEIPLDRSLARYVEPSPPPAFPVPEDLQWSTMLGTYYGWDLWLARSRSGIPCILVDRGAESDGVCVPQRVFLDGTLGVSLPFEQIEPELRPQGMTATERIDYWWLPERGVVVMRGGGAITYFGPDE
jgi:hypothetical protein